MVNNVLMNQPETAASRALPDFMVIGAMRAGTTLLHELLAAQSAVSLPCMKETDFFVREKHSAQQDYARYFDLSSDKCGEVTPNYSKRDVFPGVPAQVFANNPAARLIYIVRDPVARAISQYTHSFLSGQDLPAPEKLLESQPGQHIVNTSRYAWQLEAWLGYFTPEQIMVLDFAELTTDPAASLRRVCAHIGVQSTQTNMPAAQTNSAGQVASVPDWWLKFRDTAAGQRLRALAPRGIAAQAKALLGKGQPKKDIPVMPATVRNQIADVLREDVMKFRQISNMPFTDWSV